MCPFLIRNYCRWFMLSFFSVLQKYSYVLKIVLKFKRTTFWNIFNYFFHRKHVKLTGCFIQNFFNHTVLNRIPRRDNIDEKNSGIVRQKLFIECYQSVHLSHWHLCCQYVISRFASSTICDKNTYESVLWICHKFVIQISEYHWHIAKI